MWSRDTGLYPGLGLHPPLCAGQGFPACIVMMLCWGSAPTLASEHEWEEDLHTCNCTVVNSSAITSAPRVLQQPQQGPVEALSADN